MSDAPPPAGPDHDEPFLSMARKIVANTGNGFAGAFVIVPPAGSPRDMLVLDSTANPVMFWSSLKAMVDIAMAELDAEDRQSGRFR